MKKLVIIVLALTLVAGALALSYGPFPLSASTDPVFYNELGYHLSQQGDLSGAQEAFVTAVKLDSGYENARKNLAVAAFHNKDYLTAIEHGRILVGQHGTAEYHFDLAQSLVARARFAETDAETATAYLYEALDNFDAAGSFPHATENAEIVRRVLASV